MPVLRVFAALAVLGALLPATSARGQTPAQQAVEMAERLVREHDALDHRLDVLEKLIDDVLCRSSSTRTYSRRVRTSAAGSYRSWCFPTAACTPTSRRTTAVSSGS
jgi:hypothetical protein